MADFGGGPSQPEMQAFTSVNGNNLVDLFSGDFSYSIPLMDVGGYPLTLGYRSGITMDQEASWVGLGWNLNPGTISRNMRGLPDDFSGTGDSVLKASTIHPNITTGATVGADIELLGLPSSGFGSSVNVGVSMGLFKNNYKGWGMEQGLNASIGAGDKAKGAMTGGLSFNNNSQDGITLTPSFSANLHGKATADQSAYGAGFSISAPYSSRSGIKALQTSVGLSQFKVDRGNAIHSGSNFYSSISFASPTFIPSINLPYTSEQISFTAKVGLEELVLHPSLFVSGYQSRQYIAPADTVKSLPAYGYLNYQESNGDADALLDFNREKEIPYREQPAMPHIALPFYTHDMFSITGEGTGGQFRAYRSDIGFIHDHFMRTRDNSQRFSVDVGLGDMVHAGVDLNLNRSISQTGAWTNENALARVLAFRRSEGRFKASYFKNPSEKTIIDPAFYAAVGGDAAVAAALYQPDRSSAFILATNTLRKYRDGIATGEEIAMNEAGSIRKTRDKRTQVISYLSAREADAAGLDKYVESYAPGTFSLAPCNGTEAFPKEGVGTGLDGHYYPDLDFKGTPVVKSHQYIDYFWKHSPDIPNFEGDDFSVRWTGRVKVPETGEWVFQTTSDDGVRLWINDSLVVNDWTYHGEKKAWATLHLVAGEFYTIRMDYFEGKKKASAKLHWRGPGTGIYDWKPVPVESLYPPAQTTWTSNGITREKRVTSFRKSHHLSEVTVLNGDGRRYVYGIPVYNFVQKESSFSVDGRNRGNRMTGMVGYTDQDNSVRNNQNQEKFYSREEVPAYAHSFLLSGILSADYVDLTGNGISDDDPGDAVKFNYSRVADKQGPYKWRSPAVKDSVTFNENNRTDYRDDRGSLIYGEKELWYLHSIVSKTMVAAFFLEGRSDLPSIDERGNRTGGKAKRLKEIRLYSKPDFFASGTNAIPVKTVHFEYDYELCKGVDGDPEQGKLTLKKVWFSYNGNAKGKRNPYVFQYHQNNPSYNLKSYDSWGNYKDPGQNPGYTAASPVTNADYPFPLQDSTKASVGAGAWALDSILLPSGGGMRIVYESDDYGYVQQHRAMQMMKIAGFGNTAGDGASPLNKLYSKNLLNGDNLYVFADVPRAVASKKEVLSFYLSGVRKLYCRVAVEVPGDAFGNGTENIPCYIDIDGDNYGLVNSNRIWIRMKGISFKGDEDGDYSPIVKTALQYLKLNLPSKAYPGSENGDGLGPTEAVKMIVAQADNVKSMMLGYDNYARTRGWCINADLNRSYIRLNNPWRKKYGGGHRVKKILVYDNWDKMTQQRTAVYGQEYTYTIAEEVNGQKETVSSGVATFEPGIGAEENPLRQPIEYREKLGILGPVNNGYTEEPLGESLFPAPSVGYRQVRTRTINYKNIKSANGFSEARFYTAYDFPTYVERTVIDDDTKKRYKPALANFLRINAKHFVSVSQGFLVELNDMHGKARSQATYSQNDAERPVTYTEFRYRTENPQSDHMRLSNTVMAVNPDGSINPSAVIGKGVELMVDMREQQSVVNGNNFNVNSDVFAIPPPPFVFMLPSLLSLGQREENKFRSVAITKVVQRFGILDSVIQIDKGSLVVSRDLLYDAETGDVVVNRTMNGFDDPVYTVNYPSHWAYDGMGLAYRNIDVEYRHLAIRDGKITDGLPSGAIADFVAGDELLVAGRVKTGGSGDCDVIAASFPQYTRLWVADTSVNAGGAGTVYLMDRDGKPYTGYDADLRIIRSGRRNQLASVGHASLLENPVVYNSSTQTWSLEVNASHKVVAAGANEFSDKWKVPESKRKLITVVPGTACPAGFTYIDSLHQCVKDTAVIVGDSIKTCFMKSPYVEYSSCGAMVYYSYSADHSSYERHRLDTSNHYWRPLGATGCPYNPAESKTNDNPAAKMGGAGLRVIQSDSLSAMTSYMALPGGGEGGGAPVNGNAACAIDTLSARNGPMNRSAIWLCCDSADNGNWWGFTRSISIPSSRQYYLGVGSDNFVRIYLDGNLLFDNSAGDNENFKIWHLLPLSLVAGVHQLKVEARNSEGEKGVAVELYQNSIDELEDAVSDNELNIVFTTRSLINQKIPAQYSCPDGYSLITKDGGLACRMTYEVPDSIVSTLCLGLADTLINPYVWGLLGNWRSDRSYVLYTDRAEKDPTTATNIRRDGTIPGFTPYWVFVGDRLIAQPDTSIWVWNNRSTLYNKRGLELENTDPLHRFNAGLYGYGQSMPVAVVQNAKYREAAFEGFEDYEYQTQYCDTACPASRHVDYSGFRNWMTTAQKHTGKYSLKIPSGEQASLSFSAGAPASDGVFPPILFQSIAHACSSVGMVLKEARINNGHLLPVFSPTAGSKMLLSAWVKEEAACAGSSYTNNRIVVNYGTGSLELHPSGSIIEGWQRYEAYFDIDPAATSLTVSLQATGGVDVFFDDIRIHPFNGNMKSFVYNPVNLRLMAELDENNYATFYEYDDEGTLIRLKKETIKGIQTIKETRSALQKN